MATIAYTQTNSASCPLTYTISTLNSASAVPATYFTLTSDTMYSYGITSKDTYYVTIDFYVMNNTLGSSTLRTSLTFKITIIQNNCPLNYPVPPVSTTASSMTFQMQYYVAITSWTENYSECGATITYSILNLPSFCTFNSTSMELSCLPNSSPSHVGVFYYQVQATILSESRSINNSITVT